MHTFSKGFGVLCGLLVTAIAARYGFRTSDNNFDGYIWAFTYGAVTLGGLFGHSLGVRAWRHSKAAGALVFAASALALLISLSNEIGAMAGRGNAQQAGRIKVADTVRDLRSSLERAETERATLTVTPTDVETVKAKAAAAASAREAECNKFRGARCRDKEAAEAQALQDLETASRHKATADRVAKLDADIAALKGQIEKAGPVLEANSQGSALARLFGMPESTAATLSTYQNLAMAVAIELLIIVWLIAAEVIEHHERPAFAAASVKAATRKEQEADAVPEQHAIMGSRPLIQKAPPPRLIASQPHPIGNVATIMAEILEPGRGKVEIAALYLAYAEACEAGGKPL